jgi:uracil-DNA glycosylase
MSNQVAIAESWKPVLQQEFNKPYFDALIDFLKQEKAAGKTSRTTNICCV